MSERRRRLGRWLALWLSFNTLCFAIGIGWVSFGFLWVDIIVIFFIMAAFIAYVNNSNDALRASYADARPRQGYIVHADGSQTAVRFVATSDPGEFLAVTLDGEQVTMREDDELKIDRVGPGQVIRFNFKN